MTPSSALFSCFHATSPRQSALALTSNELLLTPLRGHVPTALHFVRRFLPFVIFRTLHPKASIHSWFLFMTPSTVVFWCVMHRQPPQSVQYLIPNDLSLTPLRGHVRQLCNSFLTPCRCFPSRCSTRALCVSKPWFILMTETMAIFSRTFKPLQYILALIANEVAVTPLHGIARVLLQFGTPPKLTEFGPDTSTLHDRSTTRVRFPRTFTSSIVCSHPRRIQNVCVVRFPIRDEHKM